MSDHSPNDFPSDQNLAGNVSDSLTQSPSGTGLLQQNLTQEIIYNRQSGVNEVDNNITTPDTTEHRRQRESQEQKSKQHPREESERKHKYCQYCGNNIEAGQVFHGKCARFHIPRCKDAAEKFYRISQCPHVLLIGIDVTYLYGQKKQDKGNKEKRAAKIKELLNKASALHNSDSGHILIHLVGLADGDNFTGAFDEFADVKLNALINDGSSFDEVYKKQRLSDCGNPNLEEFTDILVLYVKGSKYLVTSDVKTKIALDDCILDTPDLTLLEFIRKRRQSEETHPDIPINNPQDLSLLQESRNVQTKAYFQPTDCDDKVVKSVFENLKLAEYITAFTKLEKGGTYLLGVAEEANDFGSYISKKLTVKPVKISNCQEVKNSVGTTLNEKVLVCDYDGKVLENQFDDEGRNNLNKEERKSLITIRFIPECDLDPSSYVICVSARPVNGIVFYDHKGPVAYRVGKDPEEPDSIIRFTVKEWFRAFKSGRRLEQQQQLLQDHHQQQ